MRGPSQTGPSWQAALEAAREDAPSSALQDAMWNGIENAVIGVPVSSAQLSAAPSATVAPIKAAFWGAVLGSAVSVSAVAVLLHWSDGGREPSAALTHQQSEVTAVQAEALPAREAPPAALPPSVHAPAAGIAPAQPQPAPVAHARGKRIFHEPAGGSSVDPLSQEVALLTGARDAIARGDASGALFMLQMMRAMPSRQLAPEAQALEARALRALGRDGAQSRDGAAP